ncbi:hypothetical protein GOP47_0006450 [Adiantum capillus-veneris]|uniref:Fungal lipase-type domain-containing protein n=1 Tax=Adiantum capillus-veneris TaxID=13818 RepID=A0A9D4V2W6_ADICA|nr:hypothetical protein GOP47_0006450 [Adiantum capillus-veneris]
MLHVGDGHVAKMEPSQSGSGVGAFAASKRAWSKLQESQGQSSPVNMIVKGATSFQTHIGPWSVRDLTLGLAAMAKVAEKEPPPPPGEPNEELSKDSEFLARAQHWRAIAEAVYVCDGSSFSLMSHLPESLLVHAEWNPDQNSLRPTYTVSIDAPYNAVVLAIRGTSHVVDMLVNSGACPEDFRGGKSHAGFAHATEVLLKEAEPHIKRAFEQAKEVEKERGTEMKLVLTGHSMGGAVGIMCAFTLRDSYPSIECWSYSTPACLSHELAVESAEFATSFVSAYDVVPRFSFAAVEGLRKQLEEFDWEHAKSLLKDDPDWQNIEKAVNAMQGMQRKVSDGVDGVKRQMGVGDGGQDEGKAQEQQRQGNGKEKEKEDTQTQDGQQQKLDPPALYPAGRLLVLVADPPGCGKIPENRSNVPQQRNYGAYPSFEENLNTKWTLREARHKEFLQLVVSPWSVSDHMLGNLSEGLGYLQSHCPPIPLSSSS